MVPQNEFKLKGNLNQLLVKIEFDARKAGLSAIAIKNLQEDCKKVMSNDAPFQL